MTLEIVNPSDRDWTKHRFILALGDYGWTKLLVWANSLDVALDFAVNWCEDRAPGLLCDDEVNEAFAEAKARGLSDEEAWDEATVDVTTAGDHGRHIRDEDWHVLAEDPTRARIKELQAS